MKGRGLKIWVKLPESVAYTRVNKIKGYSPGEETVSTSEKSYLDQDDLYLDHDTDTIDPGEVGITVEYDGADAGQTILEENLAGVLDIEVEWKDGSKEQYSATVTKRAWSEPSSEELQRIYSLKRKAAAPVRVDAPAPPVGG